MEYKGLQCDGLIDTGADISLLSASFVDSISEKFSVNVRPMKESVKVLGGGTLEVNARCLLSFKIGNLKVEHEFWIIPMTTDCLIGGDFLSTHGCTIDYKNMAFTIKNEKVELKQINGEEVPRVLRVVLKENVKLRPYTEKVVFAKVEGADKIVDSELRMVGPPNGNNVYETGGVLVGKTLVKIKNGQVPVRLVNLSPGRKKVKKNTEVAICELCDDVIVEPTTSKAHSQDEVCEELPEHLQVIFDKSKHLSLDQQKELKQLLIEEQDIFSKGSHDLGRTTVVKHAIDTKDTLPIKQHPRRLPIGKFEEADNTVKDMLDNEVIEPSLSPWCSPIVLVKKKDGSTRFCVDYRKLNAVTQKDAYPLPRPDATLDSLSGSKWFSTLDMKSGYWQVEMDEQSKEFTAFSHGKGLWQFKVMPFGLCNSAPTFQRLMEAVLSQLPIETVLVYIDDILVHGKEFNEEIKNLKLVFQRLREANLKLNPKKCVLFAEEVMYLGHVVGRNGISVDPEKVKAIETWPAPTTVKEVRCFLGLCSYYRRFILNFAGIAKPLHRLTEKNEKFIWSKECQTAFDSLKLALQTSPILSYPDPTKQFILDTDASKVGLGAVLSQIKEDGKERVVAYYSRTLSKQEINYCATRRELLAIVNAIEHFNAYLYGTDFLLRTDHSALQWLFNFKAPKDQLARWLIKLQQYNFTIIHRPGVKHANADALSRRPCFEEKCQYCEKREVENLSSHPYRTALLTQRDSDVTESISSKKGKCWSPNELREAQLADPSLRPIIVWLEAAERPGWNTVSPYDPDVKAYWTQWASLHLMDGVLFRKLELRDQMEPQCQLIVPVSLRDDVLREMHDEPTSGHLGMEKTLSRLRTRFYWVNCRRDVERWCRRCEPCGKRKGPQKKTRAPLKQFISGAPMERLAVDVLGPLPVTESGNKYLLIIGDYFTKWTEAIPIPNQETKTIADALISQVITRFGVPLSLHSDQGRNFESKLFAEVCKILGINKTHTTPYRPQSDGMVERFNRTIEDQLAKYVDDNQKDWDRHVPFVMMAYRSAVHQSTGCSPSKLMLGREQRLPVDLLFGSPRESPTGQSYEDYADKLEACLSEVHDFARINLKIKSDNMKTRYDASSKNDSYHVGDAVRYCLPKRRKGITPKFQSNWDGPYLVKRKINDLIFEIQRSPRAKPKIVHKDRLCLYNRDPPEWFSTMSEKICSSNTEQMKNNDPIAGTSSQQKVSSSDQEQVPSQQTLQSKESSSRSKSRSSRNHRKTSMENQNTVLDTIYTQRPGKRTTRIPVRLKDYYLC